MSNRIDMDGFDELLDQANRELVASGGPKPMSAEDLELARLVIAEDKRQHQAEIKRFEERFKSIKDKTYRNN